MATIAEQLIGVGQEAQTGFAQGIQKGADLAQSIENTKLTRQKLEQAKLDLEVGKLNSVMDTMQIASKTKDTKLKNFLLQKVFPSKVKALGLENVFSTDVMEMLGTSDAAQQKLLGLQLDIDQRIRSGQITGVQALQHAKSFLSDPEALAQLDTDQIFEAQKFAASEEGRAFRAKLQAEAGFQKQEKQITSVGRQALAKDIAKEYSDYQAGGGKAGMESSLTKLESAARALETGRVETGGISTKIPGFRSDIVQSIISPELVAAKTDAQAALNTVLRQTLGAQFTENEGVRVLGQIWDDRQPPEENAKRIRAKIKELQSGVRNKEQEFVKQGFMPAARSFRDFSPESQMKIIKVRAQQSGISEEEARKQLEAQ